MRSTCLALAALLPAFAQPDAASLVQKSAAALKNYRSYQYTEEMTIDLAMPGMPGGMSLTTVVRGAPGKIRRDTKASGMDAATVISSGESTWIYLPMTKQYTKVSAGSPDEAAILDDMSFGLPERLTAHAQVLRSETLQVDGQPHDCWVVESKMDEFNPTGKAGAEMRDAVATLWYDKDLGLDLQATVSAKVEAAGKAMQMVSKTTKHLLQFDIPLPDSLFVFTPPEGAVETADLIPGAGAPAATKPPEKAAPAEAAAPVADGEPQAYVPDLKPLELLEPVLPPAAKAAGLQGMVELLVTVDPGGRVVDAEPLTGPKELRQAAIDTARQWKFRPVIRNGRPVFAYANGMVDFIDMQKPPSAAVNMDLADEMKAVERTQALRERFPRTPEQVLADTEQSLGGANGQDRGYALPDLAKAAVDAGALDKALSYANEMLQGAAQTDPRHRDWNYGNEIYTGNMVLGLVALRQDNIVKARQFLLESAKTPGSPTLGSFGPDLRLAGELLRKGEKDAVLEFLEACKSFWKIGGPRLDALIAKVRAGGDIQ